MIIDANDWAAHGRIRADVCIIGAGAAGITLALDLSGTGLDVLLLEAGGESVEKSTQALYRGAVKNPRLHSPLDRYRERRLGGSTTVWGGRCVPLDAIDFEAREYMPNSGWPISLADLEPYYPRANQLCEAGDYSYTLEQTFQRYLPAMIPGFTSQRFSDNTLERFSCPTDFGRRYTQRLRDATDIRLMLHANVISLQLKVNGCAVNTAQARTLAGRDLEIHADQFVLATGGLEVARLLLASRDVMPQGIGNDHDVVGRYYMCHIAGTLGLLQLTGEPAWHGYDIADEGVYCRRRLALTPSSQRQMQVGNFIARLHHPRITDPAHGSSVLSALFLARPLIPYEYAKRLHGDDIVPLRDWLRHVGNLVRAPHEVLAFAWHLLRDRKLAQRKYPSLIIPSRNNRFSLDFHAEQEPQPNSRVMLGRGYDALGMPQLAVDWRYSSGDIRTVARAVSALSADISASGAGRLTFNPASIEREATRYGAYGGHHLGTARMGSDPRTSVVDANCQVHGVSNLFVASAAVFPTSSQANPTLTVVALSLRLAAHLRTRIPRAVTGSPFPQRLQVAA